MNKNLFPRWQISLRSAWLIVCSILQLWIWFTVALEDLAPAFWLTCLYHMQVSHQGSYLPCVLFFRWYPRDWVCSHQDVYEAQKYRVQTPAVLKVSGSVPGLELEVCLSFASGEHLVLFTSIGFPADFWEQQFSPPQHTRCCEQAGFHCMFWGLGLSPQITLNAADSHCRFLLLSSEQAAADVTDLSLFQDFKLCH